MQELSGDVEVVGHDGVGEDFQTAVIGDLPELLAQDLLGGLVEVFFPNCMCKAVVDGGGVAGVDLKTWIHKNVDGRLVDKCRQIGAGENFVKYE